MVDIDEIASPHTIECRWDFLPKEDRGYSVVKERECGELGLYFPVKEIEVGIIAVSLQVCDIVEIDDVNAIA